MEPILAEPDLILFVVVQLSIAACFLHERDHLLFVPVEFSKKTARLILFENKSSIWIFTHFK